MAFVASPCAHFLPLAEDLRKHEPDDKDAYKISSEKEKG
jgi:hypothetical protein